MPLIVVFGALSDRIGRKPIMVAGMLLGGLTLIPAFHALASYANPGLLAFAEQNPIKITADGGCTFSLFAKPVSDCDKARNFFSRNGLSYTWAESPPGTGVVTTIGELQLTGFDEAAYRKALGEAGFKAASGTINYVGAVAIVVWLSALIGMVYGPMAAFMVEMFPRKHPSDLAVAAIPSRHWPWRLFTLRGLSAHDVPRQHLCGSLVSGAHRARHRG